MLLTDILKNTNEENIEYEDIKKALKDIEEIALQINESKKKLDNDNIFKELNINFLGKYKFSIETNRVII
jgi:hypothetical protein